MEKKIGWSNRGYLPHYDASGIYQFITIRLHDSIPAEVLEKYKLERMSDDSTRNPLLEDFLEKYDEMNYGSCALRNEQIAGITEQTLLIHHAKLYELIEWCIMPNHLHVLIKTNAETPLSRLIHSWKSFIANEANRILDRSGKFWMHDYFDRYIRDDQHFYSTIEYIRNNPVKAMLVRKAEDWPWSSVGRKER